MIYNIHYCDYVTKEGGYIGYEVVNQSGNSFIEVIQNVYEVWRQQNNKNEEEAPVILKVEGQFLEGEGEEFGRGEN